MTGLNIIIAFVLLLFGFGISWMAAPLYGALIITQEIPPEGDPFEGIEGIKKDIYRLELSELDLTEVKKTEYVRLKIVRK